jgi:2-oxoglutarate dehydrogenase E2 component (dihydrolipoamide succinyltransferase)
MLGKLILYLEVGEFVAQDETVANIETDKVTIPVNAPESGILKEVFAKEGDTVEVGKDLFKLEPKAGESKPAAAAAATVVEKPVPEKTPATKPAPVAAVKPTTPQAPTRPAGQTRGETREKLTRMRLRIAERMKEAQNSAASLTTFNEVDMSALMAMRSKHKEAFGKKHDAKLGFMSAFVKAAAQALQEIPVVNARMDMTSQEIVYHKHVDISVAVATPKGLVTPVLRNCESMSFADVERTLASLGERARDGTIGLDELAGGTFTISNGGVFGSLMGTPIINAPQAAILGMHAIKDRPTVVDGQVVARPLMYLALTYDHRLIDGREAVTFLVRIKELLEDPSRFLLGL